MERHFTIACSVGIKMNTDQIVYYTSYLYAKELRGVTAYCKQCLDDGSYITIHH